MRKNLSGLAVFCLLLTSFSSCSSKDEQMAPVEERAVLKVGVKGIEEAIAGGTGSSLRLSNKGNTVVSRQSLVSLGGVDAFVDFGEGTVSQDAPVTAKVSSTDTLSKKAASGTTKAVTSSLMENGTKFRLLIYDAAYVLVVNQVVTSGTDPQIKVDANKQYTWYAVSVNEKNANVPDINGAGVISRTGIENKDVLYASGTISTVNGANYLDIVFKRMTARVQVKLNVRGLFARIENSTSISLVKNSTNTTVLQMGDLNILTGQFNNVVDVDKAVLATSMVEESGNPSNTVKIANFFTLNTTTIPANSFKMKFNTLKVTLDDSRVRTFTPQIYTYPGAYTPTIGATYGLNIRLIESPVKVKGVLWARSNLVYSATEMDHYRLKSNPGGSTPATKDTEFWNWKSSTPTGAAGSTDPCSTVYPAGTWRMSTKQEWESIGQPNDKQEVLGLFWGAQYAYKWNRDSDYPSNPAYDDNDLTLSFGGYRTKPSTLGGSTSVVGSPGGIALGAFASGECHYWTSDNRDSNTAYAVKSAFTRVAWLFSWGNVTYPNLNKAEGRNIRCVRQIVNN
ncbi:hypothetical protein [Sphingobacterium detergens]